MLKALYDYAESRRLVPPPGYVEKSVKAYVSLAENDADFVEIEMGGEKNVLCPDICSLANGKDKCNVLAEKRSVIFSDEPTAKNQFFWDALREAGEYEPAIRTCLEIMQKPELIDKINQKLDSHKIKAGDRIAFKVDSKTILDSEAIQTWWQGFRKQFVKTKESADSVCMISGQPVIPVATTSKITGLQFVGGHSSGDALICFDKPAFCSYGLKKAENAPVSEEAFAAVKAALDSLLKEAPILSNMKFVHWYDCEIGREEDPIYQCGDFDFLKETDDKSVSQESQTTVSNTLNLFQDDDDEEEEQLTEIEKREIEISAVKNADKLIKSVESGKRIASLDSTYYILLLSGVGGRIMIRRYMRGKYADLQKNLQMWHEDLRLMNAAGTAPIPECKLKARLIRLLKYKKTDAKVFERLKDELAGITPAIITAVLTGGRLPDAVAERALRYIRSQMLASSETGNSDGTNQNTKQKNSGQSDRRRTQSLDGWACQWLKVWLIRKKRAEGEEAFLLETYNLEHPVPAYHCGGLMAVYSHIQQRAMKGVNAGVIERYYASASRTPAMVLGRLSCLSNYHLAKIEKTNYLKERLEELYVALGDKLPVTLSLEEQSYFALGYYQKWAELHTPKAEKEMGLLDEEEDKEEAELAKDKEE